MKLEVERRGIEYIPPADRHGRPSSLFTVWFATNVQITTVATGVIAVALGLDLTWAIITILIGNLVGGLFMAYHSAQGPRLGIPQMIQSRAQFGMFGAILPLILVILLYLGFFTTSAVLGGEAMAKLLHVSSVWGIVLVDALTLLMAWVGYDLIHRYDRVVSLLFAVIFIALTVKLAGSLPAHSHATGITPGNVLLAISIFATWQITWAPYVSDYSRYLPEDTPTGRTFWYTYLGSALGASWMMILGAMAGVVAANAALANITDYLSGLFGGIVWLVLITFILGILAANVMNLYGAFMTATTSITPSGRLARGWQARVAFTTIACVIGTGLAIAARGNFVASLTNFLLFLLYFLVPWTAINLTDFYLVRRGHYAIDDIFRTDGVYGAVNWKTLAIYILTILVEIPFVNTTLYVGPIATFLGGADIAWIIGLIVASVVYYVWVGRPIMRAGGYSLSDGRRDRSGRYDKKPGTA